MRSGGRSSRQHLSSRAAFLSLLYYLCMLTLRAAPRGVMCYHLEIPNRVIRELQWEHLAGCSSRARRSRWEAEVLFTLARGEINDARTGT